MGLAFRSASAIALAALTSPMWVKACGEVAEQLAH
jgi:hypothetical protein